MTSTSSSSSTDVSCVLPPSPSLCKCLRVSSWKWRSCLQPPQARPQHSRCLQCGVELSGLVEELQTLKHACASHAHAKHFSPLTMRSMSGSERWHGNAFRISKHAGCANGANNAVLIMARTASEHLVPENQAPLRHDPRQSAFCDANSTQRHEAALTSRLNRS